MDRGARYVLEKQWILTLPSVCTLQKHKDNSNQRRCPEHHTRKKTSVFDKRVKNRWATQQLIDDTTLNGTRLGVISRGKVVKMFLDLKHFSYCVTVGCWRKKSRWGRPGPAGVKDHSDPAEETAGRTQYVVCLFFFNRFSPGFGFPSTSPNKNHNRVEEKKEELKKVISLKIFHTTVPFREGANGNVAEGWQPMKELLFCDAALTANRFLLRSIWFLQFRVKECSWFWLIENTPQNTRYSYWPFVLKYRSVFWSTSTYYNE